MDGRIANVRLIQRGLYIVVPENRMHFLYISSVSDHVRSRRVSSENMNRSRLFETSSLLNQDKHSMKGFSIS